MSKISALLFVAASSAFCLWFEPLQSFASQAQDAGPAILVAGGLFTVAIAVLIRD
jgi:hypothetical protein